MASLRQLQVISIKLKYIYYISAANANTLLLTSFCTSHMGDLDTEVTLYVYSKRNSDKAVH